MEDAPSGSARAAADPVAPSTCVRVTCVPGKGRGVVAAAPIAAGAVIETCPLVILAEADAVHIGGGAGVLRYYALELTAIGRHVLMAGYGMLYNHSRTPNAEIEYAAGDACVVFRALRRIEAGEEVVIDYRFEEEEDFLPME